LRFDYRHNEMNLFTLSYEFDLRIY
jgi:hypothetical protein